MMAEIATTTHRGALHSKWSGDHRLRPTSPESHPGAALFTLGRQIGWGSCGSVFEATERSGRRVAVKVVDSTVPQKAQDVESEIALMRRLRHPNITQLYQVHRFPGRTVLVMELARGDLYNEIQRVGAMGEREAAFIFCQLLEAVGYLHAKGIAHRDIKPENVLLSGDEDSPDVKLADFGLARDLSTGTFCDSCGSRDYVAPEVFCGGIPHSLKCDIWSLGVILYVMLSNHHPFQHVSSTDDEHYGSILSSYIFYGDNWNTVSEEAKDLIGKMMVVNPDERLCIAKCLEHPWVLRWSS